MDELNKITPCRSCSGILTSLLLLLLTLMALPSTAQEQTAPPNPLIAGFQNVPTQKRLQMFWRIFGPAWKREEIDFQLEQLKQAGVGGVLTCFTYPFALDNPEQGIQNDQFLSPNFREMLHYAAQKAKEKGLRFHVCGGTGWPFGGPTVNKHDAAQQLRREILKPLSGGSYQLPPLKEGERVLAVFCGGRDVTALLQGNQLTLTDAGEKPCQVFISGPTLMQVKRAALGAEGYVVDHYSRAATLRYLDAVVAPMLESAKGLIHSVFCDSLEVYHANWTHNFPAQFRRRRGYDLIPHLPELFDDHAPTAKDLRFDFWRTAAELAEEEFAKTVYVWCKRHKVQFTLEPYGTPPLGLTAGRYCDSPWGEQYEWKSFSFSRFAASSGHLTGKRIIGTEAWTWTGIPNRLADSLADLKLCSDLHFLSGENELTGVDYPYSPRSAGSPGWTPYYGPVFNGNNPQWPFFRYFSDYVSRCQWLLQQGKPVADIALYVPTEDSFANGPTDQMPLDFLLRDRLAPGQPTGEFGLQKSLEHRSSIIHTLLTQGWNYDGIDFFAMNQLAKVSQGKLVAGDGRYSIVLLPNLEGIDLAAMEKIATFCHEGGTVIFTKRLPSRVFGLHPQEATNRLQALLKALFGMEQPPAPSLLAHPYGKGKVFFVPVGESELRQVLEQATLSPDMRTDTLQPDVSHVHRKIGKQDFYFVVNAANRPTGFTADFRVGAKSATLWNPFTGAIQPLPTTPTAEGNTRLFLALPAQGSAIVCFSPGKPDGMATIPPDFTQSQEVRCKWKVTFEGPDAPPSLETSLLTSWTEWPGAKYYSGQATYTGTLDIPSPLPQQAMLAFQQVREVAEVWVNGKCAGAVWTPPYLLDITPLLKAGTNTLEIKVGNLFVNRVLGLPDVDLRPLRAVYGNRFPAPEEKQLMSEPAPSGLIGPLRVLIQNASPKNSL